VKKHIPNKEKGIIFNNKREIVTFSNRETEKGRGNLKRAYIY